MGRAKALLPWRGRPLIVHLAGVLREAVDDIVVVASAELELPALDARVIRDRVPGLGPLGGIREALGAITGERAFVTGVDAPFLTADFVRRMLEFGAAAAPVTSDGIVQSLAAVYPRSRAEAANALIAAGRMRPLHLLEAGGFRQVAPRELPDFDALRSVNTPEEYLAALREDGAGGTATVELFGIARERIGKTAVEVSPGPLREVLEIVEATREPLPEVAAAAGYPPATATAAALARPAPPFSLVRNGVVAENFLVSLGGRELLRDGAVPIGPGDNVIVMDAAVE